MTRAEELAEIRQIVANRPSLVAALSELVADAEALRTDVGVALLAIKTERDKAEALAEAAENTINKTSMIHPMGGLDELEDALAHYRGEK